MEEMFWRFLACSLGMLAASLGIKAAVAIFGKWCRPRGLYLAWIVVLLGFLIPLRPQLEQKVSLVEIPAPLNYVSAPVILPAAGTGEVPVPAGTEKMAAAFRPSWGEIIFWVWLAGAAVVLLVQVLRYIRFQRGIHRWRTPMTEGPMWERFQGLKREMKVRGTLPLCFCENITSPMVTGYFRPVLLMPKGEWMDVSLDLVLRHELVHHRRKDLWIKGLASLAVALHWFNPGIYLVRRELTKYGEVSCDAEVVRGRGRDGRLAYLEVLADLASRSSSAAVPFSTQFYGGKQMMKKRFYGIMDTRKKRIGVSIITAAVVLIAAAGIFFGLNRPGNGWTGTVLEFERSVDVAGWIVPANHVLEFAEEIGYPIDIRLISINQSGGITPLGLPLGMRGSFGEGEVVNTIEELKAYYAEQLRIDERRENYAAIIIQGRDSLSYFKLSKIQLVDKEENVYVVEAFAYMDGMRQTDKESIVKESRVLEEILLDKLMKMKLTDEESIQTAAQAILAEELDLDPELFYISIQ